MRKARIFLYLLSAILLVLAIASTVWIDELKYAIENQTYKPDGSSSKNELGVFASYLVFLIVISPFVTSIYYILIGVMIISYVLAILFVLIASFMKETSSNENSSGVAYGIAKKPKKPKKKKVRR